MSIKVKITQFDVMNIAQKTNHSRNLFSLHQVLFLLFYVFQFEYQQAQLEAEIENLSWKIEHAETTDRGDLENQIDVAEKRRTSLLKDFLTS